MIRKLLAAIVLLLLTPLSLAAAAPDWTKTVRPTATGGRLVGNPAAKVKFTAFAAYTCPHCAHFAQQSSVPLAQAIRSGRLAVEFRPIVFDQIGLAATVIARCVPAGRFWAVNDALYAQQGQWYSRARSYLQTNADELGRAPVPDQLRELSLQGGIATVAGLTPVQAAACFADRRLIADTAKATDSAGAIASSTPTFLVAGQTYAGLDWPALSTKLRAAGLN